jgi:UDP-glucose 4-epimerase
MKVLVTGGAGYIGAHGVRQLQRAGYATLVVDNLIYGHLDFAQKSQYLIGDLQDSEFVHAIFEEHDIGAVMHFAAYAYVGESVKEPAKYYRNNVMATLNLLDAMRKYGVRKWSSLLPVPHTANLKKCQFPKHIRSVLSIHMGARS